MKDSVLLRSRSHRCTRVAPRARACSAAGARVRMSRYIVTLMLLYSLTCATVPMLLATDNATLYSCIVHNTPLGYTTVGLICGP